jgi:putative phosphotransacetylase
MKNQKQIIIPVEVSARHIHLCKNDAEKLFGKNYQFKKLKDLSQEGEFACVEKLKLTSPNPSFVRRGVMDLRVLGPVRKETQVEISLTEAIKLGIDAPIVISGNLKKVKPILEVQGPKGKIMAKAIVAKRHLHCNEIDAKKMNLKNGQIVKVEIVGERGLVFDNVVARVSPKYKLSCHIDTDEANASGLEKVCGSGKLIL